MLDQNDKLSIKSGEESSADENATVFIWMKLQKGASKCMVASLIFGMFGAHLMVGIMGHFMVYLLADRHDIHDRDAARVIGNMGSVSEIFATST